MWRADSESVEGEGIAPGLLASRDRFLDFVRLERGLSDNTSQAYGRDLDRYLMLLTARGVEAPEEASQDHVSALLRTLADLGLAPSSVARNSGSDSSRRL